MLIKTAAYFLWPASNQAALLDNHKMKLNVDKIRNDTKKVLWTVLGLFVFSFLIRAVFLVNVTGVHTPLSGDMPDYHNIAVSFLNGNGWNDLSGKWSYRPPLISAQLAAIYSIFGPDTGLARWHMVIISSVVTPLIFLVALQLLERRFWLAFGVGSLWSLYPPSIFYGSNVLTENMAALLSVASLGSFLWAARKRTFGPAILTGFLWGLSTLNRPIHLLLPFALLCVQLILHRRLTYYWSWKCWVVGLIMLIITMIPWTVRNYVVHESFMPVTSGMGWMMLMCNATLSHPNVQSGGYYKNPDLVQSLKGKNEVERDRIGRQFAMEEIRKNWRLLPRAVISRALNFWTFRPDPFTPSLTHNDWIMLFIWTPVLIFFVASFFAWSWRNDWPALVMILYAFVFILPFWGTLRFRFPVDPLIIMRAIVGLWGTVGWIRNRKTV